MYHLLVQLCRWIQSTHLALGILESTWAYPYVQLTHFTGLSLWVGTNLLLDLRLLGVGKNHSTAAQLCEALFIWNWTGFCIAILGGYMLFSTAALTYLPNPAFEIKLGILIPLGLLLHIFIQRRTREWGQTAETPVAAKIAGFVELSLWLSVISAAVLIPYFAAEP
jgi:hypothetical protein